MPHNIFMFLVGIAEIGAAGQALAQGQHKLAALYVLWGVGSGISAYL